MRDHVDLKVMTQNCASAKARWALRVVVLAMRVMAHRPDVLTCVELYAGRRGKLTRRLRKRYTCAGTYMGKVIYVRRGVDLDVHRGSLLRIRLGNGKHALAVRLVDRVSGTKIVVVVAHLSWQIKADARRYRQTQRLINAVRRRFPDTPTIYTGDFNSSIRKGKRKRDAVGEVFKARGLDESWRTARERVRDRFNSANRYKRPAPASGIHLDRVAGEGVTFLSWLLDYYTGRYGGDHFGIVVEARIPIAKGNS